RDDGDARAQGPAPRLLGAPQRATRRTRPPPLEQGAVRLPSRTRARGRRVRILVAGGAGFIGSAYVRGRLAAHPGDSIRVLDKLTYAGRRENLEGLDPDRVELVEGDIADPDAVATAIEGC